MDHKKYMKILKLDEAELKNRRAFFELTEDDLARLAGLRPFAEKVTDAVVDDFYKLLLTHVDTKKFFPDEATVRRVKRTQREYFLGLFEGRCDLAYVEDRLRVGSTHERIGLSTKWYLGAYRKYMELIKRHLVEQFKKSGEAEAAFQSIQKLVYFDIALATDTYLASKVDAIERQQAAIRELSTPVIRVHNRILLLPLIGAIDSRRAGQVMDSVLMKVSETQAKCIIIDIAGVAVVDTKVADSLVKTTAAVRLLDAHAQPPRRGDRARALARRQSHSAEEAHAAHGETDEREARMKGSIPILRLGRVLLATIQVELRDNVAKAFQEDVLTALETRGMRGVVIDISGLETVDTYVARILAETGRMAKLMGAETVLVGMRPEVAATLVRMGYSLEGVRAALNLQEGLALLRRARKRKP